MARRYSLDQWAAWLREFEGSELTVGRFSESKGVTAQTFYKWRRRLAGTGESDLPTTFVPVSVKPASEVRFEFPGGVKANVANDPDSLGPLVAVLLQAGASQ